MNRLVRSELRKLTSVTWFKVTMIIAAVITPVAAISNVFTAGRNGNAPVGTTANVHHVLSSSALTSMVMLAVGIAMAAGEYRHNTSIATFLVSPRRREVVRAKLVTAVGLGAVFGAVAFGLTLAAAVPALGEKGVHHLAGDTGQMFLGAAVATALYGALGVALGFITRSVVASIVAALLFVQLVEQAFLDSAFPALGRWLPTGANLAITHTASDPHTLLAPMAAIAVLLAWTALLTVAATRLVVRRDV
jgi:ABC-2 type transport system permease protein